MHVHVQIMLQLHNARALQPPDPQARASIAMDGGVINHSNKAAYHTEKLSILFRVVKWQ
jgi:hypothetical protein